MRVPLCVLVAFSLPLVGCTTLTTRDPPRWTEETLFAYVASLATEPSGLSEYTPLNGDDFVAVARGIDFLRSSGDKWCGDLAVEDHYVFFKRSGPSLSITITPAYVPDPENVSGVYPNEDGTQRVIVAPIDGARQLLGCGATLETEDNGLTFTRTDDFARPAEPKPKAETDESTRWNYSASALD